VPAVIPSKSAGQPAALSASSNPILNSTLDQARIEERLRRALIRAGDGLVIHALYPLIRAKRAQRFKAKRAGEMGRK
jgi:hypothetical protein